LRHLRAREATVSTAKPPLVAPGDPDAAPAARMSGSLPRRSPRCHACLAREPAHTPRAEGKDTAAGGPVVPRWCRMSDGGRLTRATRRTPTPAPSATGSKEILGPLGSFRLMATYVRTRARDSEAFSLATPVTTVTPVIFDDVEEGSI